MVLGHSSNAIIIGSLFPDLIISAKMDHLRAHSLGSELLPIIRSNHPLSDFVRAIITHGINPPGLDYFGDEKYRNHDRGYCFVKGLQIIDETIDFCHIPPELGWWKSHNIVEMGIELLISNQGDYGNLIKQAFNDQALIEQITGLLPLQTGYLGKGLQKRISGFEGIIEIKRATPESLADKYRLQMLHRHGYNIDTEKVAGLIGKAAKLVSNDLEDFFRYAHANVLNELNKI